MALATQCPNCQSRFRVQSEHLKTGGGLVRCGLCRHVFNALDHLAHFAVGEPQAAVVSPAQSKVAALPVPPTSPTLSNDQSAILALLDEAETRLPAAPIVPTTPVRNAILQPVKEGLSTRGVVTPTIPLTTPPEEWEEDPVTLMPQESEPVRAPRSRLIIEEPRVTNPSQAMRQAAVEEASSDDTTQELVDFLPEQPEFIQTLERQEKRRRVFTWLASIGALIALMVLMLQVLYMWRADIVARASSVKPLVSKLCQVADCQIELPQHIELLRITGSELQPDANNHDIYNLSLTIENQASSAQAWPFIELTLTDVQNKAVARRVFSPEEYVIPNLSNSGITPKSELIAQGLLPHRELAPKVFFDAGKVKAAGYLVYIFYP